MNPKQFSSVDALQFGWTTLRSHLAPLLLLSGAGAVLALTSQALGRGGGGGALLGLVVQGFQVAIALLLVRVSLRLYDGEPVDLAHPAPLLRGYWSFLATLLLLGLGASVGFMLLIVPGVLFALAFGFTPLFKADGERDLIEAFRQSGRLTRGARGQLFGFGLLLMALNFAGVLALGVGVVATVPMSYLAAVYVFRRLQGRTEATPHAVAFTPRVA